ncbi:MAG TPA: hypothetical protein VFE45_16565 [Coriobacteriia bacterium]|nr:hypothetical protein [Coriobacteriia bacterium]
MSEREQAKWEVRISVYRNGRRVKFNDGLGDSALHALTTAHNDLELWAQDEAQDGDDQ